MIEGNQQETQAEDTPFEKFSNKVKETTFGVLFVLLKDGQGSIAGSIISAFLDSLQMYNFIFSTSISWPWYSSRFCKYFNYISSFLDI